MTACRSCGVALCDCPDLAFAGLAPAPIPTGTKAGRAVHPATSGRIPAAGNSVPDGSHSQEGAGVCFPCDPSANHFDLVLHEDSQ